MCSSSAVNQLIDPIKQITEQVTNVSKGLATGQMFNDAISNVPIAGVGSVDFGGRLKDGIGSAFERIKGGQTAGEARVNASTNEFNRATQDNATAEAKKLRDEAAIPESAADFGLASKRRRSGKKGSNQVSQGLIASQSPAFRQSLLGG